MQIITRQKRSNRDFLSTKEQIRVHEGIQRAIFKSYLEYPMRGKIPVTETTRRFEICFQAYKQFRNEYGYSTARSIDGIYRILESALSGKVFQNATHRSSWFGSAAT